MNSWMGLLLGMAASTAFAVDAMGQAPPEEGSVAERLLMLERSYASLETRFEAQIAALPGLRSGPDAGNPALLQIAALEREVERLEAELDRVRRLAETAQREASQARREAQNAERLARDAAMRAR